ncbi:lipopolysaccharide biosynthesis protein [Zoogloea ramigera]|uniref:lipopolysaccharide biosynthesis protein n=1 Tax=Zoogloea ramigera TaxID=350 RepID=UPI00114213F1|nr:oligosaccharide flippase family protein [Zoogloea ramigera]
MRSDSTLSRVLQVAGGAALGQLLIIAASPVLTRIYTPADFGFLGVYVSVVSVIGAVAAFRYDVASSVVKSERSSNLLFRLALVLVGFVSLVSFPLLVGWQVSDFSVSGDLVGFPLLCALSVFFFGLFQAASYVTVRRKKFRDVGYARALQNGGGVLAQLTLGFVGIGWYGLALGYLSGLVLSFFFLWSRLGWFLKKDDFIKYKRRIRCVAFRHSDYAVKSAPAALIGTAGLFAPNILFSVFYGAAVAGAYVLAQRVVVLPMHFVGMAVAQVYLSKLAGAYNEKDPRFYDYVKSASVRLFAVGLIPASLLSFFGSQLFGFIFGSQWATSGVYSSFLVWAFLLQLVSSPLSTVFVIVGRQTTQFFWELGRIVSIVLSVLLANFIGLDSLFAVGFFSAVLAASYMVQLFLILKCARACSENFSESRCA